MAWSLSFTDNYSTGDLAEEVCSFQLPSGKKSTPCPQHAAAMSKWAALISAYTEMVARLKYTASPKVSCRDGAMTARSKVIGKSSYKETYKSAGRRRMLLELSGYWGSKNPSFFFPNYNPVRSSQITKISRST